MKIKPDRSSIQLDLVLLDRLALAQRICLASVIVVSGVTLAAWLVPPVGLILPRGWVLMQAYTALALLCSGLSLALSPSSRSRRMLLASQAFAGLVALMGITLLLEHIFHRSLGVDFLLTVKSDSALAQRVSWQAATFFVLLATAMAFIRTRKRPAAQVIDLLVFILCLLVLVIWSGHLFGATHLTGPPATTMVSPQTLICMMMLAYVALWCRAEHGIFAILAGVGIGSKIARIACPFALLLPYLLELGRSTIIAHRLMSVQYSSALATSLAAMMAFGLILILAWRINTLEKAIHDLSLRDELTKVYNRRGFYILAQQALRLAQRSQVPFSVLFIDLDDLKLVNDTLGHDAGSAFLRELATLLKKSFRRSDVIGRVGGDEFAVAGESSEAAIHLAVTRLEKAGAEWNAQPGRQYTLSFSYGHVTSDVNQKESLEDLLGKADSAMYRTKRHKKLLRVSESDSNRSAFRQ